jgi:predicted permease
MNSLIKDVRYGWRMLWRRPGFTACAVLVLALGVGSNTAIFSVVNAVLLRPLPYPGAEHIVSFDGVNPSKGITQSNMSAPDFADWKAQADAFESLALFTGGSATLGGDEPERVAASGVTSDFFGVLGVAPARGRAFTWEDNQPGRPGVAVISDGLWRRRFGGDPSIVGRRIELSGSQIEVVGVMPAGFGYPNNSELWAALQIDVAQQPRFNRAYQVAGRLRDGATLEEARAQMRTITERLAAAHPSSNAGWGVELNRLHDKLVAPVRTMLLVLLGAVGLVLVIACANVANLLLARAASRRREVAVRVAVGASRGRIVRQLLTESVLLALAGGAAGLLLSVWLTDLLVALAPSNTPRIVEAGLDARVFAFALVTTCLAGVGFGLAPALHATKTDLNETLKEGGRGQTDARSLLRSALVVAEVGLSLVLLVGAGLLLKSFVRLTNVSPGFEPAGVLTMRLGLPGARYPEPRKKAEFYENLLGRVRALPGVEAAGATISLPLGGSNYSVGRGFVREGQSERPEEGTNAAYFVVTPDYFRAARVPVVRGRAFDERDTEDSAKVIVVNETLARLHFAGEEPVGQRIRMHADEKFGREIVGVVGDVKARTLDAATGPQVYVPHRQDAGWGSMSLAVRTAGDPLALTPAVREEVRALDRGLPVYDVKTLDDVVAASFADRRLLSTLIAAFGAAALLLASVGLYGVISYTVGRRTHEFGVRMALGAEPRDVLRLVLRQGLALALAGVAAGVLASLAAARLMSSLLYEVSASDPFIFVLVPVLLVAVALLACYLPARRATRVDPMEALRYE